MNCDFRTELGKMRSLIERMEGNFTPYQAILNEERLINEVKENRRVETPNEFFRILDEIGDNKFVTIGYVVGANLDLPKIKKRNPLTNRMKGYDDFSVFSEEGEDEIGAIIKISAYNMRYSAFDAMNKRYGQYKDAANSIRGEYGLPPMEDKENDYANTMGVGKGTSVYGGNNQSLQGHAYSPQNIFNVHPHSVYYAINKEGHIIKALSDEQVKPYIIHKEKTPSGLKALREMGVEEEKIQEYINRIKDLKMNYIRFEANSILWLCATVNGEKILYLNSNLSRAVNEIDILPQDFLMVAKERYEVEMQDLPRE